MKILIDINERIYKKVLENKGTDNSLDSIDNLRLEVALEEGIPLKNIELVDKKILINKLRTEFDYDDVYMPRHFEDIVDDAYELTKEFDFKEV